MGDFWDDIKKKNEERRIAGIKSDIRVLEEQIKEYEDAKKKVESAKKKCNSCQSFFPAGKLHHILQFLSRRLGNDADTCLEYIRVLLEFQRSLSAAEQLAEHAVKLFPDLLEFFRELLAHTGIQLIDDALQCLCRLDKIGVLCIEKGVALRNLFVLLNRIHIDRAKLPDRIFYFQHTPL